ncbi:hypothetical protein CBM2589_A90482 [Cupriavidus taiwanensis]|uniref:Uncharacterized protein n=1 Tax=Cupriavidus taiwanensis TaxID=164546 RepID=A0A375CFW8_9BURK|nr:hypothetical protein CBM2589_A90482 [Cupriavidus taiwanensis]
MENSGAARLIVSTRQARYASPTSTYATTSHLMDRPGCSVFMRSLCAVVIFLWSPRRTLSMQGRREQETGRARSAPPSGYSIEGFGAFCKSCGTRAVAYPCSVAAACADLKNANLRVQCAHGLRACKARRAQANTTRPLWRLV